jgi:hypothetical protein
MNKVTINVKDDHEKIIKIYDMKLVDYETTQEFYEEARRVWSEYHVELASDTGTISTEYTYEQEMIMLLEEESYKQFLMMEPV